MRQLTYIEPRKLEWQEVPDPKPGPGEVVVRPEAVARCDLDAAMATAGLFSGPFPVGHEFVGTIIQIGAEVGNWAAGDRVVAPFQISCGSCGPCVEHRFAACATHRCKAGAAFGFGPDGGGHGGAMADLIAVPHADHLLRAAPAGVSNEALASIGDNVADGYRTVAPGLAEHPGAQVLIIGGAGDSIGYYAIQWALALGAGSVRYADTKVARCEIAEQLGATPEHIDGPWPRRLNRSTITVCYSRDVEGLSTAILSTDDYGICTSAAIQFSLTTPVPLLDMYTKGITLHTSRVDSRQFLPEVLDYVARGVIDPLAVPTRIVGWDEAATAWLDPGAKLVAVNDS